MTSGRLVFPALRWSAESGFAHEEPAIAAALEYGAGGFLVFGGTADAVAALSRRLRREAGRPLLIAADLERGAGQQVVGLDELPPPAALASLDDPSVLRGAGLLTAIEALSVGINWVLAPVADLDLEPDNPIVQTRAFGAEPARVAAAVAAWVAGCAAAGALACAKHFPGHGRTRSDSHDVTPVVATDAATLRETDLLPFQAAIAAGVQTIMTAHVAYPALDPSGVPATRSPVLLGLLRQELGFGGLIATDALMMAGAGGSSAEPAPLAALRAGVDVLLYPQDPAATAVLLAAEATDRRGGTRIAEALERYERAVQAAPVDEEPERLPPAGSAVAAADWLLAAPLLRGSAPALRPPLELVVVDDDQGGVWPASPNDWLERMLRDRSVRMGPGGSRVVLAFAEPRASKGRGGFGRDSLERLAAWVPGAALVVLFGHPRLAGAIPPGPPVLLAWHRQRLMQEAAARWLAARLA